MTQRPPSNPIWISLISAMLMILLVAPISADLRSDSSPEEPTALARERFTVAGRPAFVIAPVESASGAPRPWVWYAPTLEGQYPGKEEAWMFDRFCKAGVAIAGVDASESYGSPKGREIYQALYDELTRKRGFAAKPVLLARSRGGLMLYNWAVEHVESVGGIAGIYPVCDLESYPGLERAAGAYEMTADTLRERLAEHNPVERLASLAKAKVPIIHIHGDADTVVPLDANSAELARRYSALGGPVEVEIVRGRGHDLWEGWFHSERLVEFILDCALGRLSRADVPKTIYFFDSRQATPSERVLVASVAGIVDKKSPELYTGSRLWIDCLRSEYPDLDFEVERDGSVAAVLDRYKDELQGYVLYDKASINVANSVAGILRLAMVDESTVPIARAAGLERTLDVRGKDTAWVVERYGERFDRDYLFHLSPDERYHLRDFAILKNALVIYEELERDEYFAAQNDHTRVFGWASSERDFFLRCSRHDLQGVAADWLRGAAATSQWNVPLLEQRTHCDPERLETETGVHYVAFVMSDGDNVQWLTNDFCEKRWYGSPHRGKFDMTWDLSPSLAEVNPVAFNHLYAAASTGTHRDFFANAGGPGLIYPCEYPDIDGFVRANSEAMRRADQNIISVLEDCWDPAKIDAILADPQVIGAMLKIGDAYRGQHGRIHWSDGKPCVAVRYSLWEGFDTPESIARDAGDAPQDPLGSEQSYSIVNVHPWSGDPMARVLQTVEAFPEHVRVVTLEELILRLRRCFGKH